MPSVTNCLMKDPFFGVWWICWRLELVTSSKYKFNNSELCPGWKLAYSSSLVRGSVLYRLVSDCELGCKYTAVVCMVKCGKALEGFWPSRKFSMLWQLLEVCCSSFMGIFLYSSLHWAHCWGFGLSCFSTWHLCGVGKTAGRIGAVGVILEFCLWDAESQGIGLDQQRACLESGILWDQMCWFVFHWEIRFPLPLYFWVPAILCSHNMFLGWCCSCCWKFRHSLIQFVFF